MTTQASTPQQTSESGFSLIELLIAIAVVGILAALLTGAVLDIKERSTRAACVAQIRQLGTAWELYAADHNGNTPFDGRDKGTGNASPGTWKLGSRLLVFGELFPYLEIPNDIETTPDILICPSYPDHEAYKAKNLERVSKSARYWMNPDASSNTEDVDKMVTIDTNKVIICDSFFWWDPGIYGPENHEGKGMNAYIKDGSVRWIPASALVNVNKWDWNELAKAAYE